MPDKCFHEISINETNCYFGEFLLAWLMWQVNVSDDLIATNKQVKSRSKLGEKAAELLRPQSSPSHQ